MVTWRGEERSYNMSTEIRLHIHRLHVRAQTKLPGSPSYCMCLTNSKTRTHRVMHIPTQSTFRGNSFITWHDKGSSAGSFMEWESSRLYCPDVTSYQTDPLSLGSELSLWLQPTDLIFCPVKINEMLSISGVHLGREDSMHLDFSVWPKDLGSYVADSDGVSIGHFCVHQHKNMEHGRWLQCGTYLPCCINHFNLQF